MRGIPTVILLLFILFVYQMIFMDSTTVDHYFSPTFKGNSYFFQTPFPNKSKLEIHPFFTKKKHGSVENLWQLRFDEGFHKMLVGSLLVCDHTNRFRVFLSHSIHVWHIYPHFANQPLNVGRYTSPMDAMGFMATKIPARCAWWERWRWGLLINGRSIEILFFFLTGYLIGILMMANYIP